MGHEALAESRSVVLVNAVASEAECAALRDCMVAAAERERATRRGGPAYGADGMRCDGQTGRIRAPVLDPLEDDACALCDALLLRALSRVDVYLPGLADRLFGGAISGSILRNSSLAFSPGEPAANIYTAGGSFDAHTDKQSLTILLPLSRACEPELTGDFTGGGTAFWSRHDHVPHTRWTMRALRGARGACALRPHPRWWFDRRREPRSYLAARCWAPIRTTLARIGPRSRILCA
jgi:hypothetical protein